MPMNSYGLFDAHSVAFLAFPAAPERETSQRSQIPVIRPGMRHLVATGAKVCHAQIARNCCHKQLLPVLRKY
jgi:hypothetical protein